LPAWKKNDKFVPQPGGCGVGPGEKVDGRHFDARSHKEGRRKGGSLRRGEEERPRNLTLLLEKGMPLLMRARTGVEI